MNRSFRAVLALAVIAPIGIVAGCGSSSSSSADATTTQSEPTTAPATTTAPAATTPATSGATVAVTADPSGALAYVQKSLTAPAGKDTFAFTNDSPVPHNVTIESADGTELGATKTITSGKDQLSVTLPAGTYTYYCSVPGHEAAGMKGTLTVS